MCLDESTIAAYLDGELAAQERAGVAEHLEACDACRRAVEQAGAERELVRAQLDVLTAAAEREPVDALAALRRFQAPVGEGAADAPASAAPDAPAPVIAFARRRSRVRGRFVRYAAAAAAVLFAASFAFAPVRSFAEDVLRVFRMEKVQTFTLDGEQLQKVMASMQQGSAHIDLENYGDIWIDGKPQATQEVSLATAQKELGFPVVVPESLDGTRTLLLQGATTYKFKLHAQDINTMLRSLGATHLLPADVDGKVFSIEMPAILTANYERSDRLPSQEDMNAGPVLNGQYVTVAEARSPELIVPDGVDPAAIRDVLINLPILPQEVRDRLASIDNWKSTLLIPNIGGSAEDIDLNGTPAVAATAPHRSNADLSKQPWSVLWQKDGVVYGVTGDLTKEAAIGIAKQTVK